MPASRRGESPPPPPSITTVHRAARQLRRDGPRQTVKSTHTALRAAKMWRCKTSQSKTPPSRLSKIVSYTPSTELERRPSPGVWRRHFGPFGFEIRNFTRHFARVILKPEPHAGPIGDFELDVGVTGVGHVGFKGQRTVMGDAHGNDVFLEPRGKCEATGQPRKNKQLVRVETKEVYATVLLLDPTTWQWVCVLPCKKISCHYNFNILDSYARLLTMLAKVR